jgi:uncharacterized protein YjbJ (UPF0337 family)
MNWDRIDGDSKHFKGSAKYHRNKTDDQIDYSPDRQDYLAGKNQAMHGMSKDEDEYQLFDRKSMKKGRAPMSKPKHDKNKT